MEAEKILSGYCRAMDRSRMVIAVFEDGHFLEADCAYPNCPHAQSCSVAQALKSE